MTMDDQQEDVKIHNAMCVMGKKRESVAYRITDFSMKRGEQLSLVGKSGSGKSSLLNLIAGFSKVDSGSVEVCGMELHGLSEGKRDLVRRRNLGMVFQTYQLLEEFSVMENVLLGGYFSDSKEGGRSEAEELLEQVGIIDYQDRLPKELSVGQRQRVSIARALIKKPQLILADEPTGALDKETGKQVCEVLQKLCAEGRRSLLFVTHDPSLAERFERREEVGNLIDWRTS